MRVLNRVSTAFSMMGALGLVTSAGCGDDGATPPDARVDAAMFDAADPADAMVDATVLPTLIRSNTIAVTEVRISNDEANQAPFGGMEGAFSSVTFRDNTTITGTPTVTGSPVNGCQVVVYDLTGNDPDAPATHVDEGAVSVMGTGNGAYGCAFVSALGDYLCQTPDSAAAGTVATGSTATPNANGTVTFNIVGANFDGVSYRGMWVKISGFPDDEANGDFPILAAGTAGTTVASVLVVANVNALAGVSTMGATAGTYITAVGAGPLPGGGVDTFLDDGTADVTVAKGAPTGDQVVPAFSVTVKANGGGLRLGDDSAQPHALGATGAQIFNCNGTNGDCGFNTGAAEGTELNAFVIFGETTDGNLATGCNGGACQFYEMPDPVSKYATWQCSQVSFGGTATPPTVTIDATSLAAIMGTSPTRIQTTVANVAGDIAIASDQSTSTFVVIGHGVVGFTDPQ